MTLAAIKPADFGWFPYDGFTFCLGLAEGDAAWTSGHTSASFDKSIGKMSVAGTMEQQARIAYEKVLTILAAAGLGAGDVTRITENVTLSGLDDYAAAESIRRELFGQHQPTVRTVVVERLIRRTALLEVELHAVDGGGTQLRAASEAREPGTWGSFPVTAGHDGAVYLPTTVPIDAAGTVVHPGDVEAQYAYCLDRAGELLTSVGLSLDHVVTTYGYSTPATADLIGAVHDVRSDRLGGAGVLPASGGIVMSRLHHRDALVALDVTASRMPLEAIDPGWSRFADQTFVPAVKAGRTLYLSGASALDPLTGEARHAGDVGAQAEAAYGGIVDLLEHVGLGPADLLETTEYCVESAIPDYRAVAGVREKLLSPPWPASTGAICAGLLDPALLIEVLPTALFPEL